MSLPTSAAVKAALEQQRADAERQEARLAKIVEEMLDAWELIQSGDADTEAIAAFLSAYARALTRGARIPKGLRTAAAEIRRIVTSRPTDDFNEDQESCLSE